MITLSIILTVIAAISNAVMDIIQHKYDRSIFSKYNPLFWNPKESWKNKWNGVDINGKPKEKFLFSSTIFVWTTDAWHLFQFIQLKCFFLVVILQPNMFTGLITFVVLHTIYSFVFEIFYSKIFLLKK